MSFNVRVTTYKGIRQVREVLPKQYSSDSVFIRDEPYNSSQVVVVSPSAANSVPDANDSNATLMVLEVPDGQQVRYEVNLQGATGTGARTAGLASPRCSGIQIFHWNVGASISLVDAASFL